jgi:hypothetical protein
MLDLIQITALRKNYELPSSSLCKSLHFIPSPTFQNIFIKPELLLRRTSSYLILPTFSCPVPPTAAFLNFFHSPFPSFYSYFFRFFLRGPTRLLSTFPWTYVQSMLHYVLHSTYGSVLSFLCLSYLQNLNLKFFLGIVCRLLFSSHAYAREKSRFVTSVTALGPFYVRLHSNLSTS